MKSFFQRLTSCLGYACAYFLSFPLLDRKPIPRVGRTRDKKQAVEDDTAHSVKESFPKKGNEANPPHTYKGVGLTGEVKRDIVTAPRRAAPS